MNDSHQPHSLPAINLGDPMYRLLHDRLGLRLRHVMALLVLNNLAQTILIPYLHHLNRGSNLFTNFNLQDLQIWLGSFISQPIILLVYWRSVDIIPHVFGSMHDNRAIRPRGTMTVARFLQNLEARVTSRFNNAAILVIIVIALAAFNLLGWSQHRFERPIGSYPYNDFQQYALYTTIGFLRFWFVGWATARGLIFVDGLREWWRHFDAEVRPFHPDGAGGLSVIGDTTLYSGLIVGASGLFIGSSIVVNVQSNLGSLQLSALLILLVLLVLIAPLAFFLPIWSTHNAMLRARAGILERISRRLDSRVGVLYGEDDRVDDGQVAHLASLMHLREVVLRAMPVWPYGQGDVGRFSLSITPLWTVGVYIMVEVIFPGVLASLLGID